MTTGSDAAPEAAPALGLPLTGLVARVARHHGFSPGDLAETQAVAARNLAEALRCFRALAAEIPDTASNDATRDDRITCRQCANHSVGRCRVDGRGTVVGRPRRCLAFEPRPELTDRRTGRERWGWLREVDE